MLSDHLIAIRPIDPLERVPMSNVDTKKMLGSIAVGTLSVQPSVQPDRDPVKAQLLLDTLEHLPFAFSVPIDLMHNLQDGKVEAFVKWVRGVQGAVHASRRQCAGIILSVIE